MESHNDSSSGSGNAEGQSKFPQHGADEVVGSAAVVNARRAVKARHIVTVRRSIADTFRIAREWVSRIPDYEMVNENGKDLIAWKTTGSSPLRHAGSINLRESADGMTEARIEIDYEPADVAFGALFDDLTRALVAPR